MAPSQRATSRVPSPLCGGRSGWGAYSVIPPILTFPRQGGRNRWSRVAGAIPTLCLLLCPTLATALGPAVVQDTLPNGAVLLVSEQRNLPMVLVRVVLDAGARRDPAGKAGTANLTAELLTEGTRTRSAQEIKDRKSVV